MKRVSTAATLGLVAGAFVALAAPGHAQTAANLGLSGPTGPVYSGEVDIAGIVTPGVKTNGQVAKLTGVQAVLVYDSKIWDVVGTGFNSTNVFSLTTVNNPVDFTISGNSDPSKNGTFTAIDFTSARPGTQAVLTDPTNFGSFTLKLKAGVTAQDTSLYYTSVKFTQDDLNGATTTTGLNPGVFYSLTKSQPSSIGTTFNGGSITVHVVPGPSSLAVFATGALPALQMLRRRRVRKNA